MRLSYIICACVLGKVVLLASLADRSEAQNTTTVKPTPSSIVGGYLAAKGNFPFIVALEVLKEGVWTHNCGGALISSVWVLSAKHCINAANIQVMRVRGGMLCKDEVGYSSTVSYAKFYGSTDFAILRLSKALYIGGPYLSPIEIAHAPSGTPYCYIMGWGVTSPNSTTSAQCLKYSKINILDLYKCPDMFKNAWSLCVRYTTASACFGDSGGPLACYSGGKYYLIGLAWYVTTPYCGLNSFNSYTRVSYFQSFIFNTVG